MDRRDNVQRIIADFLAAVRQSAYRHRMWSPGHRILVAVSGGPDSVALLEALHRLSESEGINLAVAYFHHGLRPEADDEQLFVNSLAEALGVPFYAGRGDVAAHAEKMGRGIEAAARALRLEFLQNTASSEGYDCIALGHTASDRVETVLMNLLRGAGLWGLRGIPPVRPPFIRPLIDLWREDVRRFCEAAGLRWVTDRTNLDTSRFLRNKIRHQLLPLLESEYRAGAARAILRCAQAADDELAWTAPIVQEALDSCSERGRQRLRLRLSNLASMHPGLAVRVIRAGAESVFGPLTDWTATHYAALLEAARKGHTGLRVELPGGLQGRVEYGWLVIAPAPEPIAMPERPLPVPGQVRIPEAAMTIEAYVVPRSQAGQPGPYRAILRADLADGLVVRGRRPGDRFRPVGMGGRSKKLQDFFVDEKVPAAERDTIPLVVHPIKGIIWVVGMRIAEGVAAADATGTNPVLVLTASVCGPPPGEEV